MLSSFPDCCKIGGNICNDSVDVKGVTADSNFSDKYEHDKPLFVPQSILNLFSYPLYPTTIVKISEGDNLTSCNDLFGVLSSSKVFATVMIQAKS